MFATSSDTLGVETLNSLKNTLLKSLYDTDFILDIKKPVSTKINT